MSTKIPQPIISILSDYLSPIETHTALNSLFMYADAPGDAPEGSKPVKVQEWLRRINNQSNAPLVFLGKLIEKYMEIVEEEESDPTLYVNTSPNPRKILKEKLTYQGFCGRTPV